MTVAVIVQARIHSATRLPGKIFFEIGGWPLLRHVLWRCRQIEPGIDVICASPETDDRSAFLPICAAEDVLFVRGPEQDVLRRYVIASRAGRYDALMRVTSDCPLIDWNLCRKVLEPSPKVGSTMLLTICWPRFLMASIARPLRWTR